MAQLKKKNTFTDVYIAEEDAREILDIVDGYDELDQETGEIKHRKPTLVLAGPKGGKFHLSMPEWAFDRVQNMDIVPGDYFSGGWRNGKFVDAQFWVVDDEAEDDEA